MGSKGNVMGKMSVRPVLVVLMSVVMIVSLASCARLRVVAEEVKFDLKDRESSETSETIDPEDELPTDPTEYEFWQALHPKTQPEGHEGLWFDEEPKDIYHRKLWQSQRFWGKPLKFDVFGEFEGKGGKDVGYDGLPRICEGEAAERLESIGLTGAGDPMDSPGDYTCSFYDPSIIFSDERDLDLLIKFSSYLDIYWELTDLDDGNNILSYSRGEFYRDKRFELEFQCLAGFAVRGKTVGVLFWMADATALGNSKPQCSDAMISEQVMYNVTNGFQGLIPEAQGS